MTTLFAVLLFIHAMQSFVAGLRHLKASDDAPVPRFTPLDAMLHVPLFAIAIFYTIQSEAWGRDMLSPLHWIAGFAIGHVFFTISVLITHKSVSDARETLTDIRDLVDFVLNAPSVISRYVTVAFGEEVIWRMAGQGIIVGLLATVLPAQQAVMAGVFIVALLFTLAHEKVLRRGWLVQIEFMLFSLALGAIYYYTGSIALCMAIHFVRDVEIVYDEYCAKAMELGDRERAADYVDRRYDFRGAPQS